MYFDLLDGTRFMSLRRVMSRGAMSLRRSEATEAISRWTYNVEIAALTPFARNDKEGSRRRIGTVPFSLTCFTFFCLTFLTCFTFLTFLSSVVFAEVDCSMCHGDLAKDKVVHAAVQMGCPTCHAGIDASDVPHKKTNAITKGLSSEQPDLCYGCHDKSKFSKKTVHAAIGMGCTGCHNPHSSKNAKLLVAESPAICFNCHDKNNFEGKGVHPPVMGGMCLSCHNPHSTDTEKLLTSASPALCYTCHEKKKLEEKVMHAPVKDGMCLMCHAPHKSDFGKLLKAAAPEVCFNCHNKAEFSKRNVHPPVMGGCFDCHLPHSSKYTSLTVKAITSLCTSCHAGPEIKNGVHVVRGMSTAGHPVSGKTDPMRQGKRFTCTSCHNPHSSDWLKLGRYKNDAPFELCITCHPK